MKETADERPSCTSAWPPWPWPTSLRLTWGPQWAPQCSHLHLCWPSGSEEHETLHPQQLWASWLSWVYLHPWLWTWQCHNGYLQIFLLLTVVSLFQSFQLENGELHMGQTIHWEELCLIHHCFHLHLEISKWTIYNVLLICNLSETQHNLDFLRLMFL